MRGGGEGDAVADTKEDESVVLMLVLPFEDDGDDALVAAGVHFDTISF